MSSQVITSSLDNAGVAQRAENEPVDPHDELYALERRVEAAIGATKDQTTLTSMLALVGKESAERLWRKTVRVLRNPMRKTLN
jgi:hypothetical protein